MPNGGYQDVVRKLETLKSQFVTRVVAELDENTALLHSTRNDVGGAIQLREGYEWLHRLAGSAGTFGFKALGEQARQLEESLKPVVEADPDNMAALAESALDDHFFHRLDSLKSLLREDAGDSAIPLLHNTVAEVAPESLQRVILIEADDQISEELVRGLSRYGYRVHAFGGVDEFAASIEAGSDIAALVAHAQFLEPLQHWLAEHAVVNAVPFVFLSQEESFDTRYRIANAGAGGFFTFPLDIPALADRIEQLNQEREDNAGGKVLIVEDDDQLAEHYRLVLEAGGLEVVVVTDPPRVISELSEFRPDIVLMDLHLGHYSGASLARMVRFQPEWLGLPIVYLSSEQDQDQRLHAMAQGGDDFIEKPISDARLVNVVRTRCVRARQLAKLASRDSLTGLLKHSLAKQELVKEFARCQRYGQDAAVAMVDLDHFKSVNDTYGHATGDTVIRALANLLRHRLRKTDIIGRYGGEEFVVILPDCGVVEAEDVLNDVCNQFSGLVFSSQDQDFQVTLSAGVASLREFASAEAALNAADEALYQRKNQGRNGVTLYLKG